MLLPGWRDAFLAFQPTDRHLEYLPSDRSARYSPASFDKLLRAFPLPFQSYLPLPAQCSLLSRFVRLLTGASKQFRNRLFQIFRLGLGRVTGDGFAVAVDQEFCEIPFDRFAAQKARLGVLQKSEQRMGIAAVDIDFREDREGHAVILFAKGADLFCLAGFLGAEL